MVSYLHTTETGEHLVKVGTVIALMASLTSWNYAVIYLKSRSFDSKILNGLKFIFTRSHSHGSSEGNSTLQRAPVPLRETHSVAG